MSLYREKTEVGKLRLNEIIAATIQGEGPAMGRAAMFLRLGGCNLACSWCDTPDTWDATRFNLLESNPPTDVEDIVARLAAAAGNARVLVLTGGEPLFSQGPDLYRVLEAMRDAGMAIHVESNGTLAPSPRMLELVDQWVLSPKLGNAGPHRGRQNPTLHPVWRALHSPGGGAEQLDLKFVVRELVDVEQALAIAASAFVRLNRVWLMPEGTSPAQLAERWQWVAEVAAEHGCNASHRLHTLAWGNERGH